MSIFNEMFAHQSKGKGMQEKIDSNKTWYALLMEYIRYTLTSFNTKRDEKIFESIWVQVS